MGHLPVRRGGRLYGQRARAPYSVSTMDVATKRRPNANTLQRSKTYITSKIRADCASAHEYALGAHPNNSPKDIDPADLRKADKLRAQMEDDIQRQYKAEQKAVRKQRAKENADATERLLKATKFVHKQERKWILAGVGAEKVKSEKKPAKSKAGSQKIAPTEATSSTPAADAPVANDVAQSESTDPEADTMRNMRRASTRRSQVENSTSKYPVDIDTASPDSQQTDVVDARPTKRPQTDVLDSRPAKRLRRADSDSSARSGEDSPQWAHSWVDIEESEGFVSISSTQDAWSTTTYSSVDADGGEDDDARELQEQQVASSEFLREELSLEQPSGSHEAQEQEVEMVVAEDTPTEGVTKILTNHELAAILSSLQSVSPSAEHSGASSHGDGEGSQRTPPSSPNSGDNAGNDQA
jgi:hypothetical protein